MRTTVRYALLSIIAALLFSSPALRAADTLPAQIADDAFWKFIDSSSESGGEFQSENFLSNETGFQAVLPDSFANDEARWRVHGSRAGTELHLHQRHPAEDCIHHRYPPAKHARAHDLQSRVRNVSRPGRFRCAAFSLKATRRVKRKIDRRRTVQRVRRGAAAG